MMDSKQQYRDFCDIEKSIPIFSKDWWLDSVCGEDNWNVVLVEKGGQIVASLPYYKRGRLSFSIITMPKLTQTMGPYIKYPHNQGYSKKLSWEKELLSDLILKLPKVASFCQKFNYRYTNWLPFYWFGYSQTTRYTYVIERMEELDAVFSKFSHAKRKNIKKAEKQLKVKFDLPAKEFYQNLQLTLAKQDLKIVYGFDLFKKIYDAAYLRDAGKTIYAVDDAGNLHSALFLIWDNKSAYNLISTIDPEFRNSGSASLLIRDAIKFLSCKTARFDFEGSMIEGVENSFRQFGAIQKPYFQISKVNSKLLGLLQYIKEFFF